MASRHRRRSRRCERRRILLRFGWIIEVASTQGSASCLRRVRSDAAPTREPGSPRGSPSRARRSPEACPRTGPVRDERTRPPRATRRWVATASPIGRQLRRPLGRTNMRVGRARCESPRIDPSPAIRASRSATASSPAASRPPIPNTPRRDLRGRGRLGGGPPIAPAMSPTATTPPASEAHPPRRRRPPPRRGVVAPGLPPASGRSPVRDRPHVGQVEVDMGVHEGRRQQDVPEVEIRPLTGPTLPASTAITPSSPTHRGGISSPLNGGCRRQKPDRSGARAVPEGLQGFWGSRDDICSADSTREPAGSRAFATLPPPPSALPGRGPERFANWNQACVESASSSPRSPCPPWVASPRKSTTTSLPPTGEGAQVIEARQETERTAVQRGPLRNQMQSYVEKLEEAESQITTRDRGSPEQFEGLLDQGRTSIGP